MKTGAAKAEKRRGKREKIKNPPRRNGGAANINHRLQIIDRRLRLKSASRLMKNRCKREVLKSLFRHDYLSRILPSNDSVTTCHGINLPLF